MKVCHLTTVHPSDDIRIFRKQCISLSKFGYDVSLISLKGKSQFVHNVNVIGLNWQHSTNRIFRILFGPFLVFFAAIRIRAAIYHFHDPELLFVGLVLRIMGKKVIYDVQEDDLYDIQDRDYV
jgi:hypothetical protein